MAVATAERPFEIGDRIEWESEDGSKRQGEVRAMGDPGVTTDNAWLPWNTKGLRKVNVPEVTDYAARHKTDEPMTGARLLSLPLDQVTPSPQNPRGPASMGDLQALADDIRINGQINPITVRQTDDDRYEVITGERRFRACALAELPTILAINRGPISLGAALVERVRENAQREQLTPLEEAKAIEFLLSADQTQEQTAAIMGKSQEWVSRTRNLGRMPGEVQEMLARERISRSVAEALLPLAEWPKVMVDYARNAASGNWSSRATAQEVKAKIDALTYEKNVKTTVTTTTKRTETQPAGRINFDEDEEEETLDIPAGERMAQEALANDPEVPPVVVNIAPTEEQIAAAKAKQELRESLQQRFTDLSDVLWTHICAAIEAGTDCLLLTEIEAMVRNYTGDGQSELEFTIDGDDEETDE